MIIITYIVLAVYAISLLFILLYALAQFNLLLNYRKAQKRQEDLPKLDLSKIDEVPYVTVQLPLYNELYVVERLLDNIALLNYPKDRLDIQVLDDSTDESLQITAAKIRELQKTGLDISHITRTDRSGFKAGALKEGLKTSKGKYVAIFDSDFLPQTDWLLETVPYFINETIGLVQTRWGHINRNHSLLTKVQAFALDAHFTLEQVGRNSKEHFINFNGTAGIWRKECILDAGNWEGDTLTEDLDLSYRAQLKNWKFKYLENIETPAELPMEISAARSQQFRWNKGGAENFQKMLKKVLSSKTISAKTKIHGILHLLNSTMFLNVLIVAVLSVPMLYIKNEYTHLRGYFIVMSFFLVSTLLFFICYWNMYKRIHGTGVKKFIEFTGMFFTFFAVAMGFSLNNSLAVLEGHLGKRSEFVRTPKFNAISSASKTGKNKYIKNKISFKIILEGLFTLYFIFGLYSAFIVGSQGGDFGLFPFHIMLTVGFGYVFTKSITARF
jgi:cellulose synthase/poly-beta-1,6-N-acetylglucosamine synthase-like glycosyltransferase